MSIDIELYKVFYEVVKYKNISKAAESMYITQSAVSQSIQKLERLLGEKIFHRTKLGVELTEEGEKLYKYIKDSIETINNAENIFSNYINLENGNVRVGGDDVLFSNIILNPLTKFMKKYPNIEVDCISKDTDELLQDLSNREVDVVVLNTTYTSKKYSNITIIPLINPTYCLYCTKEYAQNHTFDNKNYDDHKMIIPKMPTVRRKIFDSYCKKNNLEIKAQYETNSYYMTNDLVDKNLGIGFCRLQNVKDNSNIEILKEIKLEDNYDGIAIPKKHLCNKATIELVNIIKQYYKV